MNKKVFLAVTSLIFFLGAAYVYLDGLKPTTSSCSHLRYRGKVIITDGFYKGMTGTAAEVFELNRVTLYLYDGPYIHIECSKVENLKDFDIQGYCQNEFKKDDPKAEEKVKKCLDKATAILEE